MCVFLKEIVVFRLHLHLLHCCLLLFQLILYFWVLYHLPVLNILSFGCQFRGILLRKLEKQVGVLVPILQCNENEL